MIYTEKIAHHREDDGELLGFLVSDSSGWQAQTVFGYTISRASSRAGAEAILNEQGQEFLKGVWQYLDKDDRDWHPCIIKKAYEHQVILNRTNVMGYQDADTFKRVILDDPSETNFVKSQ